MNSFIETLNHWGDHFLNFAWPMLWQSSLLIAIIFVLDFALRRKIRAAIRYTLWLVVLVKLLLPPSLALPTSVTWWLLPSPQPSAKPQTTAFVVNYGDQSAFTVPLQSQPTPAPIQPKMSVAAWALAASCAVSAVLLAWLLFRWRQINQKVRRATASEELIPILHEARRLTHLRPGIPLKLTDDSMSPAVCGLFHPVILLPQSLVNKLSAGQLRAVLLHEAIHLRRGDVWVNCAQALLQIFYWWHPLLWLANARIRRVREEAVDDAVMLALCDDAEIYAPTLLEVARLAFNRPLASLGLVGILESRSALRQRIERLINFNAPRKAGLTVASILGILAFSAVALPMGEAPEQTNAPTASASNLTNAANASGINTNAVTGILSDTNFQARVRALEQRTGVEKLAEPEVVTTSGRQVQRMRTDYVLQQTQYTSDAGRDLSTSTNAFEEKLKAGNLVQDGKLLYEIGKFEEAETNFNQALELNPDNQGALYYLSLVKQVIYAREEHNGTSSVADSRVQVPNAWSPKVGIGLPVPNPYFTNNDIHTSPGREMINRKLNSLHLESVSWSNGLPLSEVIRYLAEQSKLHDPDKKGINFIFNPNVEGGGGGTAAAGRLDPTTGMLVAPAPGGAGETVLASVIKVKLVLQNASLHDAMDAVMLAADRPIKYSIEDYAVVISPKPPGPEPPTLEMRVFKVDPNTFASGLRGIPGLQTNAVAVATAAQSHFRELGVDLTAPGRSIAYGDRLGLLFVKATASELDTIERVVQALNQINPQIHIKARFIEVPKDGFVMPQLFTNAVAGPMTGILSDPEFRTMLQALEHQKGVVTLAEPECVTTSGRQTQMRVTEPVAGVTNWPIQTTSSNSISTVPNIGNTEIGPVVDVVPYVLSDGYTVCLKVTTQVLTFLGYEEAPAVPAPIAPDKLAPKQTTLPHFRAQNNDTIVNLWDGQTVVLGSTNLQNFVFITATIVDPAGNRVHSDDELRHIQEKAKSEIPPQPKISTPSP